MAGVDDDRIHELADYLFNIDEDETESDALDISQEPYKKVPEPQAQGAQYGPTRTRPRTARSTTSRRRTARSTRRSSSARENNPNFASRARRPQPRDADAALAEGETDSGDSESVGPLAPGGGASSGDDLSRSPAARERAAPRAGAAGAAAGPDARPTTRRRSRPRRRPPRARDARDADMTSVSVSADVGFIPEVVIYHLWPATCAKLCRGCTRRPELAATRTRTRISNAADCSSVRVLNAGDARPLAPPPAAARPFRRGDPHDAAVRNFRE